MPRGAAFCGRCCADRGHQSAKTTRKCWGIEDASSEAAQDELNARMEPKAFEQCNYEAMKVWPAPKT
jgi:hypothetical protein